MKGIDDVSDNSRQIIENTERVEVARHGDTTEWAVHLRGTFKGELPAGWSESGVRELTFTLEEWNKTSGGAANPPALNEKYLTEFFESPEITWEQWREEVKPHWNNQQVIVADSDAPKEGDE